MVPGEETAHGSADRILDVKCCCKAVYVHNIQKLVAFSLSADYILFKDQRPSFGKDCPEYWQGLVKMFSILFLLELYLAHIFSRFSLKVWL